MVIELKEQHNKNKIEYNEEILREILNRIMKGTLSIIPISLTTYFAQICS